MPDANWMFAQLQINKGQAFAYTLAVTAVEIMEQIDHRHQIYKNSPQLSVQALLPQPLNEFQLALFSGMEKVLHTSEDEEVKISYDREISNYLTKFALQFALKIPHLDKTLFLINDLETILASDELLIVIDCAEWAGSAHPIFSYLITKDHQPILLSGKINPDEWDDSVGKSEIFNATVVARSQIVKEPGRDRLLRKRKVHPAAQDILMNIEESLWGRPLHEVLENYGISDKKNIYIVPHGPLHYLPFHLLGSSDKPLCERFRISYLPHIQLIKTNRPGSLYPKSGLFCVGVDYSRSNYLRTLSSAIAEA
jgi:hypothetical protein